MTTRWCARKGKYPLSRGTLARIIDTVAQFSPKAVALDVLLLDAGDEADDMALTDALARNRSVIAGAAVFDEATQTVGADGDGALARVPIADSFVLPLDRFSQSAAIGIVNVATDYAGTPRLVPMVFRTGDRIEASFPLQAASIALDAKPVFEPDRIVLGDRAIPTDLGQRLPISYYGPHGTIETVSAATVLGGGLIREQVEDRIVVIGATVIGSGDVFPTPFDPVLPGVEVISTAISHLRRRRRPRPRQPDPPCRRGPGCRACRWFSSTLLAWRRSALGLLAMSGGDGSVARRELRLLHSRHMAEHGLADSPRPCLPRSCSVRRRSGSTVGGRSVFARQNELLQRFQAPALRDWLARNPRFLAEPVRQEAAIVFIDLSGFTSFSEVTSAQSMRELLDDFYRLVEQDAEAHKGVITNFMGDGAMIVFGLPEPTPRRSGECAALLGRARRACPRLARPRSRQRSPSASASSSARIAARSSRRVSAAAASSRSPRRATASTWRAG